MRVIDKIAIGVVAVMNDDRCMGRSKEKGTTSVVGGPWRIVDVSPPTRTHLRHRGPAVVHAIVTVMKKTGRLTLWRSRVVREHRRLR